MKPLILLVDDDEGTLRIVTAQLRRLECDVHAVSSGFDAIDVTLSTTYDLILMDCKMPEMDGYEATRQIRANSVLDTPIVALTASSYSERHASLEAGMNDFLCKPTNMDDIQSILEKWLHDSPVG